MKFIYLNLNYTWKVFFLTIIFSNSYCQTVEINYDFLLFDEKDNYGDIRVEKIILTTNQTESLLKRTAKDTVFICELFGIFESGKDFDRKYSLTEFKDLKSSSYYFVGPYAKRTVKDSGYNISWRIEKESKKVLNYNCQKATCDFRGRSYVAYFTKEIPVKNGPFKFDGLPGLILEVASTDKMVKITARAVQILDTISIENPFIKHSTITWSDFKSSYKKYFESIINYKTDVDSEVFIPNRGIEIYVD